MHECSRLPIVLIWNYLGRRLLVFSNEIPVAVRHWLKSLGHLLARKAELHRSGSIADGSVIEGSRPHH